MDDGQVLIDGPAGEHGKAVAVASANIGNVQQVIEDKSLGLVQDRTGIRL